MTTTPRETIRPDALSLPPTQPIDITPWVTEAGVNQSA